MLWLVPLVGLMGCQSVDDEAGGLADVLQEFADDDDADPPGVEAIEPLKAADRPAGAYHKLPDALIVAPVEVWRYYNQSAGCLQDYPPNWNQPGYDDSGWASGKAELGYGDGDEQKVISYGTNANNKCRTQLFRRKFTIDDSPRPPTLYSSLIVKLLRDDGAAVYLNGKQIVVDNINLGPNAQLDFLDFAMYEVGGSDEDEFHEHTMFDDEPIENNLVVGENVLAVEVHQISPTNPDVSFNLALLGRLETPNQFTTRAFSSAEATIDQSSPNTRLGGDDECKVDGRSGENNSDTRDQVCLAR